jgi:hypothetical protein
VSISSDDRTDSTEGPDGNYNSEHHSHVDMSMEDEVDAPDGVDLDNNAQMEMDDDYEV